MKNYFTNAKKETSQVNIKLMDIHSQIIALQNHKIIIELENLTNIYYDLKEENKKLAKEISKLKNDIDKHQKVEMNLVLKVKDKNNDSKEGQ